MPLRRLALGLPFALVLSSGVLHDRTGISTPSATPEPGIERTIVDVPTPRTGFAMVTVNRPPAPIGNPDLAVDSAQLVDLAQPTTDRSGPHPTASDQGWFLVGDSTFTAAAAHLGHGSAFPGVGFELAPFVGSPNPLRAPAADFVGTVVLGVSIWDVDIEDAEAYANAVAHYRSLGHQVLVVEVPEQFGPGVDVVTTPHEQAGLRALNRMVSADLGCALIPWTVRDVETRGDVDGSDDHVHPTATGVAELLDNLHRFADRTCEPAPQQVDGRVGVG